MAAFVAPTVSPSLSSSFVSRPAHLSRDASAPVPASARPATTPVMIVLPGLDTETQDSYTFSRYILGPFQPTVLNPGSDDEEREVAIRSAYRHIFGNAYIMEEEREELRVHESQYKLGAITAKEFVRALAKSSAYRTRFFEGASQYRFVELNFMHLLGRAPDSQAECAEHMNQYHSNGYDAEIDSYIDSAEYNSVFGEDNIPFLRFRGAYTPCDSFNKQCAIKGGWANSDKAMGGAALSGYNGSDGRQMCDRISSYIYGEPTPYESVAENTPLRTTAPNWIAFPNPALEPTPSFVTPAEVNDLRETVNALQAQYDAELAKRIERGSDPLGPFRAMVRDMAPMLDRGYAYSTPELAHPQAKLPETDDSALSKYGFKATDYRRLGLQMYCDTVSRTERDLEEAKAKLRAYEKALDSTTPMTPTAELPGVVVQKVTTTMGETVEVSRPRISATAPVPTAAASAPAEEKSGIKIGPITLPFSMPF